MSAIEDTIQRFGYQLGIEHLALGQSGMLCLEIERLGALFIEQLHNDVLMYLARQVPAYRNDVAGKALQLCHFSHNHPYPLNAAFLEDTRLLFACRIPDADFDLAVLSQVLDLLTELHNRIAEGDQ